MSGDNGDELQTLFHEKNLKEENHISFKPLLPLPPHDEPTLSHATFVVSANEFWLRPADWESFLNDTFTTELEAFYSNPENRDAIACQPSRDLLKGSPCVVAHHATSSAAQDPDDPLMFFRAMALVVGDKEILARFVDFGDTAFVNEDMVFKLVPPYDAIPPLGYPCCLEGCNTTNFLTSTARERFISTIESLNYEVMVAYPEVEPEHLAELSSNGKETPKSIIVEIYHAETGELIVAKPDAEETYKKKKKKRKSRRKKKISISEESCLSESDEEPGLFYMQHKIDQMMGLGAPAIYRPEGSSVDGPVYSSSLNADSAFSSTVEGVTSPMVDRHQYESTSSMDSNTETISPKHDGLEHSPTSTGDVQLQRTEVAIPNPKFARIRWLLVHALDIFKSLAIVPFIVIRWLLFSN